MREQKKITWTIGLKEEDALGVLGEVIQDVLPRYLSHLSGGCDYGWTKACWRDDGAYHQEVFIGEFIKERSFMISATVELHKFEDTIKKMKKRIRDLRHWHDIDDQFQWVHVTVQDVRGYHFDATLT